MRRGACKWTLLAAPLWALLGCGGEPAPAASETPDVAAIESGVLAAAERVPTTAVRFGSVASVIIASGSVEARRTTAIGAPVSGRLVEVFVDVGDEVEAEAPLFQVDPRPYEIAAAEARAGHALARAESEQARQEAARADQLARRKMVAEQQHGRQRTNALVAAAQAEQAESRLARAEHDLERTLVRAPYAGSIVERRAHEGAMVTLGSGPVVVLQESGRLEAVLDIPEASRVAVRPGDPARLRVEGQPDPLPSRVLAVSDRIEPESRTYRIRVPVDDPTGTIKAGAFVRAEIEPTARSGVLVVDRAAILAREGRTFVFRLSDGVAERVPIRVGVTGTSEVEVLNGVASGDRVVVGEAVERLESGARVLDGSPLEQL